MSCNFLEYIENEIYDKRIFHLLKFYWAVNNWDVGVLGLFDNRVRKGGYRICIKDMLETSYVLIFLQEK